MRISVSSGILSLPIFPVPSEEMLLRKYNLKRLIKMGSNENCYGPSPLAIQALQKGLPGVHRYPEVYGAPLKSTLGSFLKIDPSQIVLGNGSTEVVELIAKAFLQPGEKCITATETFPIYQMAVSAVNAVCHTVPLREDCFDLQGILDAIRSDTRVLFIANPNNPTGTALPQDEIIRFIDAVPSNVLVVLDEAYREYAGQTSESVFDVESRPNVILLRTFSKVYGLAGLRIGYAICSKEVAGYLNHVPMPYSINSIAQLAAAAALADQDHVKMCVEKNFEQRERMQKAFAAYGYPHVPSQANFILLKGVDQPAALCERLLQKGIVVAPVSHFHVPDGVRITLGTPEENDILLSAL
jgi:histidinol-phosphate aminotransferase